MDRICNTCTSADTRHLGRLLALFDFFFFFLQTLLESLAATWTSVIPLGRGVIMKSVSYFDFLELTARKRAQRCFFFFTGSQIGLCAYHMFPIDVVDRICRTADT